MDLQINNCYPPLSAILTASAKWRRWHRAVCAWLVTLAELICSMAEMLMNSQPIVLLCMFFKSTSMLAILSRDDNHDLVYNIMIPFYDDIMKM